MIREFLCQNDGRDACFTLHHGQADGRGPKIPYRNAGRQWAGIAKIRDQFDWKKKMDRMLGIYREAVKRAG
jgi:hypothetical protein